MKLTQTLLALPLFLACVPAQAEEAPRALYRAGKSTVMPSTDTYWDYIKFQPGTPLLFMARVEDGLTVFDVDRNKVVRHLPDTRGANGPVILPQFNRGYIAMTDGSMLVLDLRKLEIIDRLKLDPEALNSGIFDPATGRIHMISQENENGATWYTLDAATGRRISKTHFPFHKMDDPATDGAGNIYAPARLDDIVLHLDATTLEEKARWSVGCNVSKVRYQASTNRIIGACLGDNPVMFALDPATGKVTARVPVGRGLDGLAIDEARHRIVTSNGVDGTLTVIAQDGPDAYRFLGQVNTRNNARMMEIDRRTGVLYVVNSDSTHLPDPATGRLRRYHHPDTYYIQAWTPD